MKALVQARYLGQDGVFARFALDHGFEARVGLVEDDIGRFTLRRPGGYLLDRGWSVAPGGLEPPFAGRPRDDLSGFALPPVEVAEEDGAVVLRGPAMSARVRLHPFGVEWTREGEASPFLKDRATQAYFASLKNGAARHFIARDKGEKHYGLGDKTGRLDKTGRRFRVDAVDPCGFDAETSDPLYKMIPFYIVDGPQGGHGIFYDNLSTASVDLGATLDNYHGLFRSYEQDDGDLDYYVIAGPSVRATTRRFSWLVGGQALAPRWSLGFGMTSMALADAADADRRIAEFIAQCRAHEIPCESFHFGSGYLMTDGKRYAFEWNRTKFPDPKASIAAIRAQGVRTAANLKPCLLDDHPRLHELQGGGLIRDASTGAPAVAQFWDGLGYHLDFTDPAARAWWRKGLEERLLDIGLDTVWNDNNEYEIWDEDAECAGEGRPFRLALARPAQPLLMTKLSYETQAAHAPGVRPYAITRGGPAGLARYAQTWSGDNATAWKTLRFNLAQGLTMSLSGLHNIGHDVGGFHGPSPGPELLARFAELCCLWPRFVMNSWNDDGVTTTPWLHPQVLPQVRAAMALRLRLMPYLYTQMARSSALDEPVARPILLDFPHDPAAAQDDCFLLGPDLLVAPVLDEGATRRAVWLPANPGGWIDLNDGRVHMGGPVDVPAPLGRLPVFARAGAMIAQDDGAGGVVMVAYGQGAAKGEVFLDDGATSQWRTRGALLRVELSPQGVATARAGAYSGDAPDPAFLLRPLAWRREQERQEPLFIL